MQIEPETAVDVTKRLKRIQGQIAGILKMIDDERSCEDVVTQVAAASKALNRVGFKVVTSGMRQCFEIDGVERLEESSERIEKLFLSLA